MQLITVWVVPVAVAVILIAGLVRGVPVFTEFIAGAKEGLESCVQLLPPLIGLLGAVTLLRQSGALELLGQSLQPLTARLGIPTELLPLILLRPVSGSGSIALLEDLFRSSGPDSLAGRIAAVMAGSTETTFYTVTVYFGAVGIRRTRQAIPAALMGDFACTVAAVAITQLTQL